MPTPAPIPTPTGDVYPSGWDGSVGGAKTTVTMKPAPGVQAPSTVILQDGSSVTPGLNGTIVVDSRFVASLQSAGFVLVTASGATVP